MVRRQDELKFPLLFNHIRLRKKQGLLIFITCRTTNVEKYIISKLKKEFSSEFSIHELGFETVDYAPIEFIVLSSDYSPINLYIISSFPFNAFYKKNASMADNIKRLLARFNVGRDHIPDKDLKLIIICPPELEDQIALEAPDFYRFINYSTSFASEDKSQFLIRGEKEELKKVTMDRERKLNFLFESLDAGLLDKDKADIYFELGKLYHELFDMDKALFHLRKAESLYKKLKNEKKLAAVLGKIGVVYFALEQTDKMLEYQKQALIVSRKAGYFQGEADALNNIGVICYDIGELEEALGYFNEALAIDRKIGYLKGEAITLGNIGLLYQNMAQSNKAIEFLKASELIYKKMKLPIPGAFATPLKKLIPQSRISKKKYKKAKRVSYMIQCAYNPAHTFEKVFKIEESSGGVTTEIDTYCPYCNKEVKVTVKGRVSPDKTIFR